jgi:hypothetical protein
VPQQGALTVVDTNVAVVASLRSGMSPACALVCIQALGDIMGGGRIALDDHRLILREYMSNLSPSGQPGVGDRFLKWVLTNQANPARCIQVTITPRADDPSDFEEFPNDPELAAFDPSDRKFVAVAAAHPTRPPVLEASDSRWWGWKEALERHGVRVTFLCPEELARMYRQRARKR